MSGVLFCNIAYMKYYNGTVKGDVPVNGGEYVRKNNDANEKYNFYEEDDGYIYGFVETKYADGFEKGKRPYQIHIERIDSDYIDKEYVEDVVVIFCAKSNHTKPSVIVGWYKDAIVYRRRDKYNSHEYNIKVKRENALLLDEQDRNYEIPRSKESNDYIGFGQSNIWYADDGEASLKFRDDALKYIDDYKKYTKSEIDIDCPEKEEDQIIHATTLEVDELKRVAVAKTNEHPKVKENVVSKQYERDPYIKEYVRRRANGFCQLCKKEAPFIKKDGTPFLEVHHIIELANGGEDSIENAVALCPNCHRKMHYAKNENDVRRLQESNLKLSEDIGVGTMVVHKKWGQGKIEAMEDGMATIIFGNQKIQIIIDTALSKGIIRVAY